jgi:hypothetical protein
VNLRETIGSKLVIVVITIHNNIRQITIDIGWLKSRLSTGQPLKDLKIKINNATKSNGSVGIYNPNAVSLNSWRFKLNGTEISITPRNKSIRLIPHHGNKIKKGKKANHIKSK